MAGLLCGQSPFPPTETCQQSQAAPPTPKSQPWPLVTHSWVMSLLPGQPALSHPAKTFRNTAGMAGDLRGLALSGLPGWLGPGPCQAQKQPWSSPAAQRGARLRAQDLRDPDRPVPGSGLALFPFQEE